MTTGIGTDSAPLIRVDALRRHYRRGPQTVKALDFLDLTVDRGEFVAVVGASGSGKSTLLNLLAGLDTPTDGAVLVEGRRLADFSRGELATYRASHVGIIFQSFQLIPHWTSLENVDLAFCFGPKAPDRRARARAMLSKLGLSDRLDHRPADLSGGEQQRVAIARALVRDPDVLLADEPTGNLDAENSTLIMDVLTDIRREGRAVVVTTHDVAMAERYAGRIVSLEYGKIVGQRRSGRGVSR